MIAPRLVLVGSPGVSCPISLSRSPFMSGASAGFWPLSSFDSRKAPLLAKANASPLGVLSCCASGRPASSLSTAARRPLEVCSEGGRFCRSLSNPSSEPWRLCWLTNCWVTANCSWRLLSGTNFSVWLSCTWALSKVPMRNGCSLSMLRVLPLRAVLSRLTIERNTAG
ncbi:hypothetical protein D3C72_1687950 [compost metagenome]